MRLFYERGREEKRRGFPSFLPRQTCGVAAELSRGHTTHIASNNAERKKKKRLPLLASPSVYPFLTLHSLHVNFSHGCRSPTQSSISVCLPPWQNQWAVLGAGVDAAAEYKAGAHLTETHCYISISSQSHGVFALFVPKAL